MKLLRFEELVLWSNLEKAAFRLQFHPRATVITGGNGTGKSSLLKSLYGTLGASPPGEHSRWRSAEVVSSLRFRVDDVRFRMIHHGKRFALFDSDDRLLGSFSSVTNGLAPAIADLFNFRLMLTTRGDASLQQQATPAFLFLPFYIDQDQGWNKKFASFDRLQQFATPHRDMLDFHFGIRPSAYYEAKSQLSEIDREAATAREERASTDRVLTDLDRRLGQASLTPNIDEYKAEIARLLERCQLLRAEEEELGQRMGDAYRAVSELKDQLAIAEHALVETRRDGAFAEQLGSDTVRCPMCHASYDNDFAAQFSIAADEDGLLGLIGRLRDATLAAEVKYRSVQADTEAARARAGEVSHLLDVKRGEIELRDVIRSQGKWEVLAALREKLAELGEAIQSLELRADPIRTKLKDFSNPKARNQILEYYSTQMGRILQNLGLPDLPTADFRRPEVGLRETGSRLPRAILAFNLASIRTIAKYSSCALCPLVIDSPHQQDLEPDNWARVRACIRDELPSGLQLILATTDDGGTDFGGIVVRMTHPNSLLRPEMNEGAAAELRPLIELSFRQGAGLTQD